MPALYRDVECRFFEVHGHGGGTAERAAVIRHIHPAHGDVPTPVYFVRMGMGGTRPYTAKVLDGSIQRNAKTLVMVGTAPRCDIHQRSERTAMQGAHEVLVFLAHLKLSLGFAIADAQHPYADLLAAAVACVEVLYKPVAIHKKSIADARAGFKFCIYGPPAKGIPGNTIKDRADIICCRTILRVFAIYGVFVSRG